MPKRRYARNAIGQFAKTAGGGRAATVTGQKNVYAHKAPIGPGFTVNDVLRHQDARSSHGIPNGKISAKHVQKARGVKQARKFDSAAGRAKLDAAEKDFLNTNSHVYPNWDKQKQDWGHRGSRDAMRFLDDVRSGKIAHLHKLEQDYSRRLKADPKDIASDARRINNENRTQREETKAELRVRLTKPGSRRRRRA